MPLKDVKRTASELPNVSTDRGNGADPNVIPETDMAILKTLGLAVGNRLKRGRYGVVFEGHFTEAFSVAKLAEAGQLTGEGSAAAAGAVGEKSAKVELQKKPLLHYLFIRPEQKREVIACSESIKSNSSIDSNSSGGSISVSSDGNSSGGGLNDMAPGRKFGLKFCDIELRKAYHIEEVEQRLMQEINFVRRVDYTASTGAIVRHYAVFATSATRYYLLMELAEDNLQCVISAYVAANRLLPAKQVLAMYASLVAAVRSLHQQKLTYGMMRTSNILVFGQTTPLPPPTTTTTTNTSSPVTPQTTAAVGKVGGKVGGQQEVSGGGVKGSTPTTSTSSSRETAPFHLKIADFVASKDASNITADAFDEAVEGDLDDLYYVHSELFTLTKLDFAQFLAFRESLKILTDFGTRRNAMDILDKVLEMVRKFALEQKE